MIRTKSLLLAAPLALAAWTGLLWVGGCAPPQSGGPQAERREGSGGGGGGMDENSTTAFWDTRTTGNSTASLDRQPTHEEIERLLERSERGDPEATRIVEGYLSRLKIRVPEQLMTPPAGPSGPTSTPSGPTSPSGPTAPTGPTGPATGPTAPTGPTGPVVAGTPSTQAHSYTPTTYFPTYYPTTPTTSGTTATPTAPTGTTTTPTTPTGPTGGTPSPTGPPPPGTRPPSAGPARAPTGPQPGFAGVAAQLFNIPPGMPAPGDEIWVIERPAVPVAAGGEDFGPLDGRGGIVARRPGIDSYVPVPLAHTAVEARVSAFVATVDVTQQYVNPWSEKIEAVYVFPLPADAAVHEFVMTVGERRIRGIIRERGEAERVYAAARAAGHVASLLTQERPNVFTQKLANLEPGKRIDIRLRFVHTLPYLDGCYEWAFPLVVGPRFNPPGTTDGIGAVGYGGNGESQPTKVVHLQPGQRTGHDVAITLDVDAGVAIEELACATHDVDARTAGGRATVRLLPHDAIPNKDFVCRWRVAGDRLKTTCLTQPDGDGGGTFALVCYPPRAADRLVRQPLEMVFVLDCSGSMNGVPIAKAKAAVQRALCRLSPDDTFQIIRFSVGASTLGRCPIHATPENVAAGLAYVRSLDSEGGTMMIEGIRAALDFPCDPARMRVVSFLTDGFIGNEGEILGAVSTKIGTSRIFSFGVGSSPNRFLLEQMARLGRGAVAWVGLDDATGTGAVDAFYERLAHPALTDIGLEFSGWAVSDVFPRRIPDLFVGRPVIVTGRYRGEPGDMVRIAGRLAGARHEVLVETDRGARAEHAGIPFVWARARIGDAYERWMWDVRQAEACQAEITRVALDHGLVSPWTAYVAVDASRLTAGPDAGSVPVQVPLPAGMKPAGTARGE